MGAIAQGLRLKLRDLAQQDARILRDLEDAFKEAKQPKRLK